MTADEREQEERRQLCRQERVGQNNAAAEWDRAWRRRMEALNLRFRARDLAGDAEQHLQPLPPAFDL